jgi:hypothetical protein
MSFCLFFNDCILKRHESGVNYLWKERGKAGTGCSNGEHMTTLHYILAGKCYTETNQFQQLVHAHQISLVFVPL